MAAAMAASPDDEQVVALVAPVLAAFPPAEPDLRAMAGFLRGMASERRKLREGLAAAHAKSREDRREVQAGPWTYGVFSDGGASPATRMRPPVVRLM